MFEEKLVESISPIQHHFSDSLNAFRKTNPTSDIGSWMQTLSKEDICNLQIKLKNFLSPLPLGISEREGFDFVYLAFAAESLRCHKSVNKLTWEKREMILQELFQQLNFEIESR